MKKLKSWFLAGLISLFLLFGCGYIDGKYDYSDFALYRTAEEIQNIQDSLVLFWKIQYIKPDPERGIPQGTAYMYRGIGISVDGQTLITLKHLLEIVKTVPVWTPFGTQQMPIETEKTSYFLDESLTIPLGHKKTEGNSQEEGSDIAILWRKDGLPFPTFPVKVGNSDELKIGHKLLLHRWPGTKFQGWYPATVAGFDIGRDCSWYDKPNIFMVSEEALPGDSGSPVLAIRDGKFELVGLIVGGRTVVAVGWALKINYILEQTDDLILEKVIEELEVS